MSAVHAPFTDRRRTLRVPLGVQVEEFDGTAYAVDISVGGLCFQLASPPEIGAELTLSFQLPATAGIQTRVRVIWVDCPTTATQELRYCEVGVQFLALEPKERDAIARFVDERSYFWPESEA